MAAQDAVEHIFLVILITVVRARGTIDFNVDFTYLTGNSC